MERLTLFSVEEFWDEILKSWFQDTDHLVFTLLTEMEVLRSVKVEGHDCSVTFDQKFVETYKRNLVSNRKELENGEIDLA